MGEGAIVCCRMIRIRLLALPALLLLVAACGDDDGPSVPTEPYTCDDVTCQSRVDVCVLSSMGSRCADYVEVEGGFVANCADYVATLCPAGSRGTVCTEQPELPDGGLPDAGTPPLYPPGARVVECR